MLAGATSRALLVVHIRVVRTGQKVCSGAVGQQAFDYTHRTFDFVGFGSCRLIFS